MALKIGGVFTSSVRQAVFVDRSHLWKGKPYKALLSLSGGAKGRNNLGRITAWKKGGGVKRRYRQIDFCRRRFGDIAVVERIEYDPNRTAHIALIRYQDGEVSYILAPHSLAPGEEVVSGSITDVKIGNAMYLQNIPIGTLVHNLELKPGKGGQFARSAGASAQLIGKEAEYVLLRLRSGETRKVLGICMATIGVVSNMDNQNINLGKAGRSRLLGIRPTVRGVAMNPVDHPHGGGEGKTSGGGHPVTPWGKSTKGKRTRHKRRNSNFIVSSRHSKRGS